MFEIRITEFPRGVITDPQADLAKLVNARWGKPPYRIASQEPIERNGYTGIDTTFTVEDRTFREWAFLIEFTEATITAGASGKRVDSIPVAKFFRSMQFR